METETALKTILAFKGSSLNQKLGELKLYLLKKGKNDIPNYDHVYESALVIKQISSQINEIVHATGIIKALPKILTDDEVIIDLSLASGAEGEGIDLVTNYRIAEFKFSRWQSNSSNGSRKRQVFADFVNLFMKQSSLKKELYVFDAKKIIKFFTSKNAQWKNVLSKSGGLDKKLEHYIKLQGINSLSLNDIYCQSGVRVIDLEELMDDY